MTQESDAEFREEDEVNSVQYDPSIIVLYAEKLYKKANSIIALYTFSFTFLGGFLGNHFASKGSELIASAGLGIFLGCIGYAIGFEKSLALKLQAQIALCQAEIERNTRPSKSMASSEFKARKNPPLSSV